MRRSKRHKSSTSSNRFGLRMSSPPGNGPCTLDALALLGEFGERDAHQLVSPLAPTRRGGTTRGGVILHSPLHVDGTEHGRHDSPASLRGTSHSKCQPSSKWT